VVIPRKLPLGFDELWPLSPLLAFFGRKIAFFGPSWPAQFCAGFSWAEELGPVQLLALKKQPVAPVGWYFLLIIYTKIGLVGQFWE